MGRRWTLTSDQLVGGLWATHICLDGRPVARTRPTWTSRRQMDHDIAATLGGLDGTSRGRARTHRTVAGTHVTIDVDGDVWFETLVSWDDPDEAQAAGMAMLTCIVEATAPLVRLGLVRRPTPAGS